MGRASETALDTLPEAQEIVATVSQCAETARAAGESFQCIVGSEERPWQEAEAAFNGGENLCLHNVGFAFPSLGERSSALQALWPASPRVRVSAYLSPSGQGFGALHVDTRAILTLQVTGTKAWVFEQDASLPWPDEGAVAIEGRLYKSSDVETRCGVSLPLDFDALAVKRAVLTPGSLLFTPAGVLHAAVADGGPSYSLAFGFSKPVEWA